MQLSEEKTKQTYWKERGRVLFICKQNDGVCRKPMGQKVLRTNNSVWQGHGKQGDPEKWKRNETFIHMKTCI